MDFENQPTNEFNPSTTSSFENTAPRPQNNLVLSIVATVLGICSPCCISLILGIVAIVFATQVNTKFDQGEIAAEEQSAKNSKILSYIALGIVAVYLVYAIVMIILNGTDAFLSSYKDALNSVEN